MLLVGIGTFCSLALAVVNAAPLATPPQSALPTPSLQVDKFENCDVRAWVRAPDLSPNLISAAQARLVLNGTDCEKLVKWEVGLRFRERATVRIPRHNVAIPRAPEWNSTTDDSYYREREDSVFPEADNQAWRSSPYEQRREQYQAQIANRSLWEIHGSVREVFDSRIVLSQSGPKSSSPALEAVKDFAVAIPNTIFPPSARNDMHFGGSDEDISTKEYSELMYYFRLTLRNGTHLDYPAGRTVFLPSETNHVASREPLLRSASVKLERPTSARSFDPMSEEKADNRTFFEVKIEFPESGVNFHQGDQIFLNTTIRRVGPATEFPSYIDLLRSTSDNLTWAGSFGRDQEQKTRLERSLPSFLLRQTRSYQERTTPEKSRKQKELERIDAHRGQSCQGAFARGMSMHGRRPNGVDLDKSLEVQSVLINFTIPIDALPSASGTFKDLLSHLQINLHTISADLYEKERASGGKKIFTDDELWSADRYAFHSLARTPVSFSHNGNVSIVVLPSIPVSSSSVLPPSAALPYTNPAASAPVLLNELPTSIHEVTFGTVGMTQPEQTTEAEIKEAAKWFHSGNEMRRSSGEWWKPDGARQLAGQAWAKKLQFEIDEAIEKQEMEDKAQFLVQVATA